MKLVIPDETYLQEIAAYRQELLEAGSGMDGCGPLRRMEVGEWLAACRAFQRPETTPPDLVPATQFLFVREEDGKAVGMLQVRHVLSGYLETVAGHIGYSVRPSERRRGYAKAMLAAALPYCWDKLGLSRVLISCVEDNEASRRTIESCGGVYESTVLDPRGGRMIRRYWISRPRRLLVTGFEPFGGADCNPSWEAVRALPEQVEGWSLARLRLPVMFGGAARQAIAAVENMRAEAVLCVGQAGGRAAITPERIGVNLRFAAQPDNADLQPQDQPVIPGGPDGIFATLPARAMADAIRAAGIPAQVSYSAGTYVCNDLLYSLLHHFANTGVRVGFIHVPYMDGQGAPSLPLERITQALECAIRAI